MTHAVANLSQSSRPGLDKPSSGRILFVSTTPHQGGIERASVRLASDLLRLGGDGISLAFACRPGSFTQELCEKNGVPVYVYAPRNSGDLASVCKLASIIRTYKPDVVHVHSRRDYLPAALAVGLAGMRGHRCALFFHCHMVRALGEPRRLSGAYFSRRVDRVLAVSQSVRTNLLTQHPQLAAEQVVVIPNSVDLNKIAPPERNIRAKVRKDWGIPEEAIVIGMMGRLDAKGQSYLIDIAPTLLQSVNTPLRFLFVGGEGPAGFEKTLRELAKNKGVEGEMILTGVQEDVAPFLSAMDIFAHLPLDEAFGLAIAEAMAMRLPVAASLAAGCCEIVQEGVTGYLVDVADKQKLAKTILSLVESPTLRQEMGAEGAKRVQELYSTESQVENLVALYAQRISANSNPG